MFVLIWPQPNNPQNLAMAGNWEMGKTRKKHAIRQGYDPMSMESLHVHTRKACATPTNHVNESAADHERRSIVPDIYIPVVLSIFLELSIHFILPIQSPVCSCLPRPNKPKTWPRLEIARWARRKRNARCVGITLCGSRTHTYNTALPLRPRRPQRRRRNPSSRSSKKFDFLC